MIQASVATYVSSSLTAMGISGKFFFVLLHAPPGDTSHTTIVEQVRDNPQPYTGGQQIVDYGGQNLSISGTGSITFPIEDSQNLYK